MRSVNKVTLIGNLTRDAVTKPTPNGVDYCTFGVATNRTVVTKSGERKQETQFHECASFKPWIVKLAKSGALTKGKYIFVEGYLKTRSWDDPDGKRFYRTEVMVDENLIMLHPPKHGEAEVTAEHVDEEVAPVKEAEDDLF